MYTDGVLPDVFSFSALMSVGEKMLASLFLKLWGLGPAAGSWPFTCSLRCHVKTSCQILSDAELDVRALGHLLLEPR